MSDIVTAAYETWDEEERENKQNKISSMEDNKKNYAEGLAAARKLIEYGVSELKESEDERVKRILLSISSKMSFHLRDIFTEEEFQCFDAWSNTWLEKQGKNNMGISEATKQKLEDSLNKTLEKETPESWNEFLEKQGERQIVHSKEDFNDGYRLGYKEARENMFGSVEWSEEDENLVNEVIQLIEDGSLPKEEKECYKERLKSLKDRCTRKPTPKLEEEDKKLLDEVIGLIKDSALSREERDSYVISLAYIKLKYY